MKANTALVTLAVALVMLGVAAVSSAYAAIRVADRDIDMWVRTALRQDERVDASRITVGTSDGIVTLSGVVENLAAKEYADREAKKVSGVLGVVNQLVVEPAWRSDHDIEQAVRRRILNSAVVNSNDIAVSSVGGSVTLTGEVDSWSEWDEAGLLARGVGGVRKVTNDLTTRWELARTDTEIKNDAVAALERDVYTTGLPIAVTVEDGVITLTGSVGNAFEKERAGDTVRWIANVRGVDNVLDVEWEWNREVRDQAPEPSDSSLRRAVRAELDHDWRLDSSKVNVDVTNGHVVLDGTVASDYERRVAERDAGDVVGVGWVTNDLFTRYDEREDSVILEAVRFDLGSDSVVGDSHITAAVVNGTVTLSGEVPTWYQKFHAGDVAAGVRGVRRVVNDLRVSKTTWKSDADLTEAVKSRLTWNWTTWWVHDDIGVTVENGIATLSGDVNKWSQRREAGIVAAETQGVRKVDNRITVKGYDYPWDEWYTKDTYGGESRH